MHRGVPSEPDECTDREDGYFAGSGCIGGHGPCMSPTTPILNLAKYIASKTRPAKNVVEKSNAVYFLLDIMKIYSPVNINENVTWNSVTKNQKWNMSILQIIMQTFYHVDIRWQSQFKK